VESRKLEAWFATLGGERRASEMDSEESEARSLVCEELGEEWRKDRKGLGSVGKGRRESIFRTQRQQQYQTCSDILRHVSTFLESPRVFKKSDDMMKLTRRRSKENVLCDS